MQNKSVVKKDLLRRKIKEYFSKHPKSNSVVIKADVGDFKTIWKVVREGKRYNIVEVNTNREQFIFEAEKCESAPLEEAPYGSASGAFAALGKLVASSDMKQIATPQGRQHFVSMAMPHISKLQGPEKESARQLLSGMGFTQDELIKLLNLQNSPMKIQQQPMRPATTLAPQAQGAMPGTVNASRSRPGKIVREADEEDKKKKKKDEKEQPKKKEPVKAPVDKLETIPTEDPEADVGIETTPKDTADEPEDTVVPTKNPSMEELVVGKSLAGQTVKSASIELSPDGGKLTLDLVSAAAPASLEWKKTGKVVFNFNGRPYVLQRG